MEPDPAGFPGLLTRARAGDPAALAELFDVYGRVVRLAVRRRLPDRLRHQFDSLDFAQDVWVSFLALPPDRVAFATPAALAGFLARVAENKVTDEVRRRFDTQAHNVSREVPLAEPGGLADPAPSPSARAEVAEEWAALAAALPAGQRVVVERLRDGWTQAEIAADLNLAVRTVERIVRRLKDVCAEDRP